MKDETIVAVSETTKGFMELINDDIVTGIENAVENMEQVLKQELNKQLEPTVKELQRVSRKMSCGGFADKRKESTEDVLTKKEKEEIKDLKEQIKQFEENDKKKSELLERLVEQNQKLLGILEELMEG